MKKTLLWVTLVSAVLVSIAIAAQTLTRQATGSAQLEPINDSGIRGEILFLDTGSPTQGLVLSGTATGLDPTQTYLSLLYDVGSVPGGPNACTPPPNSDLTIAKMFTAFWTVASDGTGTLFRQKTGTAYVALSDVATVSIRKVTPGQNPPFFNILQACGEIHRNP